MIDLLPLVDYLRGKFTYVIDLPTDRLPESRTLKDSDQWVRITYDSLRTPHEIDIMEDSASEAGNQLLGFIHISLSARREQYPTAFYDLYKALIHYRPEPLQAIEVRAFTFVQTKFIEDNDRLISDMTWAYTFDRYITDKRGTCYGSTN